MVVCDFRIEDIAVFPAETDSPLVVDSDAPLTGPIAGKLLKPIAGRGAEKIEGGGAVKLFQFALRDSLYILRKLG
jgi:hypothetical protein